MGKPHPVLNALLAISSVHPFPTPDMLLDTAEYINELNKSTKTFVYFLIYDFYRTCENSPYEKLPPGVTAINSNMGLAITIPDLHPRLQHVLSLLPAVELEMNI